MTRRYLLTAFALLCCLADFAQYDAKAKFTKIIIPDAAPKGMVDPMIYGQMLEDCNDSVVYDGLVSREGTLNRRASALLHGLNIPVMRWPAGTSIFDYYWERGIGPLAERKPQKEIIWHGYEYYTFGTDEFLQWCDTLGIVPYINFNMSNTLRDPASLGDALRWVEYVNSDTTTLMGKLRKQYGHPQPYGVTFWCIGNENYLPCYGHVRETASQYARELNRWATTLKAFSPELSLLGVGHLAEWNDTVLAACGKDLDFLTEHFYMFSHIKDGQLQEANRTLFSSLLLERELTNMCKHLSASNKALGRESSPVRFSIDEWNNRHSVFRNGRYEFTRQDARRLYDIPSVASFLNTFIRFSPYVGMANYIFPINGHGLVKTRGQQDAYTTPLYDVFRLYRRYMVGSRVEAQVTGPGVAGLDVDKLAVEGSIDPKLGHQKADACYVDAAATVDDSGTLNIAVTNRSIDKKQSIRIKSPAGFRASEVWLVESKNVNDTNSAQSAKVSAKRVKASTCMTLSPCGFCLIRMERKQ